MERQLDVLVAGAGPAGAVIAAQLAGHCTVALAGRTPSGRQIGESLPGAASVPLRDLGLWDRFLAQGHRPAWSHASAWGQSETVQRDALLDPQGHGWILGRTAFDGLLRDAATERGAEWLAGAMLRAAHHEPGARHPWLCELLTADGIPLRLRCRLLVDASGRSARAARLAGAAVHRTDKLVCLHAWLPPGRDTAAWAGATLIEAAPQGWWYSVQVPHGDTVLAFHTDADQPAVRECKTQAGLLAYAREQTLLIRARCEGLDARAQPVGIAPAYSQYCAAAAGVDWMAVGDAALAFDPLASQGLFNSLCTGLQGAQHAIAHLDGNAQALPAWTHHVDGVRAAYARNLAAYYAMEQRWPREPFWGRRLELAKAAAGAPAMAYS
ncbi:FAD-dependent monooxygenase [Ramlibacter sp. WS9]|uniref:FAD-dependent monooxygenase n=1 Tax=Ramlibacter sp. WS9 TaxID=1882741 RepID=UPI00130518A3|nr:FAD-dependent monooxygenase [Ramlibacter sp. WS9]